MREPHSYRPYPDSSRRDSLQGAADSTSQDQRPVWDTPDNRDYLVMTSAQVERRLGNNSPMFLYDEQVIDVGGKQPEKIPPGMIYCSDRDRWMPVAWVSDTSK